MLAQIEISYSRVSCIQNRIKEDILIKLLYDIISKNDNSMTTE
jgi:hypothetical protein